MRCGRVQEIRLAAAAVFMFSMVAACGSGVARDLPSRDNADDPPSLSPPNDLAIVPDRNGGFLVVDGDAGGDAAGRGAAFLRTNDRSTRQVAKISTALRSPVLWPSADGSYVAVGMACAEDTDDDLAPSICPNPPLSLVRIQQDNTTEVTSLGLTGSGSAGFTAAPLPDGALAVLGFIKGSYLPHLFTIDAAGGSPTDLGRVEARQLCSSASGAYAYPNDVSKASTDRRIYKIAPGHAEVVGQMPRVDSDVSTLSPCSEDGTVLISGFENGKLVHVTVDLANPDGEPAAAPRPPDDGKLILARDGHYVAWTKTRERQESEGKDTWELNKQVGDAWVHLGTIATREPPLLTTLGGDESAAVITDGPSERQLAVFR